MRRPPPERHVHGSLLTRLDARDRALLARWTIDRTTAGRSAWIALTHLGGAWCTIGAAAVPLLAGGALRRAAVRALVALIVSHGLVQLLKRNVIRARPPCRLDSDPPIAIPDAFSFPSGHATAAMSVAFIYAVAFPAAAPPLLMLAAAIGFSRVILGVHYPGDVLAGQLIALVTDVVVLSVR
jgi:undecaprenyl-diphosphatase